MAKQTKLVRFMDIDWIGESRVKFDLAYGETPVLDQEEGIWVHFHKKLNKKQAKLVAEFQARFACTVRVTRAITVSVLFDDSEDEFSGMISFSTKNKYRKITPEERAKLDNAMEHMWFSLTDHTKDLVDTLNQIKPGTAEYNY